MWGSCLQTLFFCDDDVIRACVSRGSIGDGETRAIRVCIRNRNPVEAPLVSQSRLAEGYDIKCGVGMQDGAGICGLLTDNRSSGVFVFIGADISFVVDRAWEAALVDGGKNIGGRRIVSRNLIQGRTADEQSHCGSEPAIVG